MKLSLITSTYQRAEMLVKKALPSILSQESEDFEWIVVNDGRDEATRLAISRCSDVIPITYLEIDHDGFGLCKARNLALREATGDLVAYIDDDNQLRPNYAESIIRFFSQNPLTKYAVPIQNRRRDIVRNGETLKTGQPFLSFKPDLHPEAFVNPKKTLFDSNGFSHVRRDSPQWNTGLWIYPDYEYFLQCISLWGIEGGRVIPEVLVDYVQTNEGQVGQSNYGVWSDELKRIWEQREEYPILSQLGAEQWFPEIIEGYRKKFESGSSVEAFAAPSQERK